MHIYFNSEQLTLIKTALTTSLEDPTLNEIDREHTETILKHIDNQKQLQSSKLAEQYRSYAQNNLSTDGECEFDDDTLISIGDDDGAYVMGWIWVRETDI